MIINLKKCFKVNKRKCACAEMLQCDEEAPANCTSDGTIILRVLNRTVSNDVGHESGIGSDCDNDSNNGAADPSPLSPSTPSSSSHPSSSDDRLHTLDDQLAPHTCDGGSAPVESTSGFADHVTSGGDSDLQDLAELYAGEMPHDVMDVRLPEPYAQLVLPPPPPEPEPEVNSRLKADSTVSEVDSTHVRSPVRLRILYRYKYINL